MTLTTNACFGIFFIKDISLLNRQVLQVCYINFIQSESFDSALATIWILNKHIPSNCSINLLFSSKSSVDHRIQSRIHISAICTCLHIIRACKQYLCRKFELRRALWEPICTYHKTPTAGLGVVSENQRVTRKKIEFASSHRFQLKKCHCFIFKQDISNMPLKRTRTQSRSYIPPESVISLNYSFDWN